MDQLIFEVHADAASYTVYQENATNTIIVEEVKFDEFSEIVDKEKLSFSDFNSYWKVFTQKTNWHYFHPLFIAVEYRDMVKAALEDVDWNIFPDIKWQQSHQKQWDKVLTDPANYYTKKK